ncbi:MAG: zinc ribbon domain-containing protein [Chloroflexi bacterium]|nr:zinc ribbon domain-containing protein [Chloroflexota bacterium]
MQDDEREPGAQRPEGAEAEANQGSQEPAPPTDGGVETPREEAPDAAEAWPSEPARDTTETAEWRAPDRDPTPPPSEVEAYPAAAALDDPGPAAAAAHSVPAAESAVGESTLCPRCGTENRPGLAFCRSCGQRLMAAGVSTTLERPGAPEGSMACPRCGTHNRAGVAFCQNCGANLRGVGSGYVPPAVAGEQPAIERETGRRGAVLGPVVLLVGLVGLVTAYLLPFAYGSGSLWERASGSNGYGAAFWAGYPDVGAALADQAYFGLAAPVPLLGLLLVALAVAGLLRATPGPVQTVGLAIAALWSVGLAVLFVVVELLGNWEGDLVGLLRVLTPSGIIFFLASLIVLIGTLTRFGRS